MRVPGSSLGAEADRSHQETSILLMSVLAACFDLQWKEAETYRNIYQKHLDGEALDAGQASSQNLAPPRVQVSRSHSLLPVLEEFTLQK